METNYTDSPPSPFLKEELLRELGLAPYARERLVEARERGTISPQEIAALLGNALLKDRVKMAKAIQELTKLFAGINIKIEISHTHTHTHQHTHTVTPRTPRVVRQTKRQTEKTEMPVMPPDNEPDARELEALKDEKETALEELIPDPVLDGDGTELNSYYRAVRKHRFLSFEEIYESGRKWREQGDANAWTNLVLHHLRLVMRIAQKYIGRGLDFDDLVQEGNIGLMIAADKFDYRKGFRFTTYAIWWIRHAITIAIANFHGTVRIPAHMGEYRQKMLRVMAELGAELEREPLVEEIAARSGEEVEKVRSALKHWNFTYTSLNELVEYHRSGSDADGVEQGDRMVDERAILPSTSLEIQEKLEEETRALLLLTATLRALPIQDRWKEAFRAYYGLDGGSTDDLKLEDVGARFGVTRERIRQLNQKTWAALREAGIHMDDATLMEQMRRVDELEKLAAVTAVLPPKEEETPLQENDLCMVPEKEKEIIEKVLSAVSAVCEVEKAQLTRRRVRGHPERAEAQQIAMYLLVEEYKIPLKLLAQAVFSRPRSSLYKAIATVSEKLELDTAFAEKLGEIKKLAQKKGGGTAVTPVAPTATASDILTAVAKTYATTSERLTAKGTKRSERDTLPWARKILTYLLHKDAGWNEEQIACEFNWKGYTAEGNVRHDVREVKTLLEADADVKEEIENVRKRYQ